MFTLIVLSAVFTAVQCGQIDIKSLKNDGSKLSPEHPHPLAPRHSPRNSFTQYIPSDYYTNRRIEHMKRIQYEMLLRRMHKFTGYPFFEDEDDVDFLDLSYPSWYPIIWTRKTIQEENEHLTKKAETTGKTENANNEEESTTETKSQETNDKTETPMAVTVTENPEENSEVEENVTEEAKENYSTTTELYNDEGKQMVDETEENSTSSTKAATEETEAQEVSEIDLFQEASTTEETFNIQREDGRVVFEDSTAGKLKFPES